MRSLRFSVGSGSFLLGLEDGCGSQFRPLAHAEEGRFLVHQRPGRAGQDALHRVTGEVAGLFARIDVGHAHPDAIDQVGQLDRLHRADLYALAALDARGQEILFVEGPGRPQAFGPGVHQRQEAGQRGARHPARKQDGAQPLAPRAC
jgi:hypothetical protein